MIFLQRLTAAVIFIIDSIMASGEISAGWQKKVGGGIRGREVVQSNTENFSKYFHRSERRH